MLSKRKGISPVVAIVILIAVAVALGIAVAFWATGLIGTLGQVEKLEIRTAYASGSGPWTITLKGANTGTADVTIVEVTINGKPISGNDTAAFYIPANANSASYTLPTDPSAPISSGQSFKVVITLTSGQTATLTSGQTIEIALITGSGTAFKRTVVLP